MNGNNDYFQVKLDEFVESVERDAPKFLDFIIVKTIKQGNDFRQGIRKGAFGEDLVMWIRLDSQKPVKVTVEPGSK